VLKLFSLFTDDESISVLLHVSSHYERQNQSSKGHGITHASLPQNLPHSCYFRFSHVACKAYIRSRVYFITYEHCNAMQYSEYLSDISVILTNPTSAQNKVH
jgi:hypothetical protein